MLKFIGNQFKKPTGFWGKIISFMMKKGNRYAYEKIIKCLEIKQNEKILEIGYGHGIGIDKISSDFDCFITGIDFSELMYTEAQKRNKKHIGNRKVELYFGDFLNSQLELKNYDKVFCINVVYFWDNLENPFLKIKTGLKEGGTFCMYMAHRDDLKKLKFTIDEIFNKYTIEQVVSTLESLGFKDINYTYDKGYLVKCKK